MKRVDGVVGNFNDEPDLAEAVADHEQAGTLETVELDDTERKRSRLRVTSDAGTDLGVLVDQPELTAGDVLLRNEERAVVVAFEEREAFVIEFSAGEAAVSTGVTLGHRIGNQHWDIAIEDATIYIPVEADRAIIEDVLGPYIPEGATTRYEVVDAERFVDGSDPDAEHSHGDHDDSHDHSHEHDDDEHIHEHDRNDGDRTYDHEHDHHSHNGSPPATPSEGEPQ